MKKLTFNARMLELIDDVDTLIAYAKKKDGDIYLAQLQGRKQGLMEALAMYRAETNENKGADDDNA